MKILYFGGGLGNQIFQYAFYLHIKSTFPNHKIYGVYSKQLLSEHRGLEIDKKFNVTLPKSKWYASLITYSMYVLKKLFGISKYIDVNLEKFENKHALVLNAFKYTKEYLPKGEWLKFNVNIETLTSQNQLILSKIHASNSVFIHVRRNDYLSDKYKDRFQGTCPLKYYQSAIALIREKVQNPHFFCFSDDIQWMKENIGISNEEADYIDWNKNEDSYLDMYLMSNCKGAIIANSSFSFWGAKLGFEKTIVYYPLHWINSPESNPNIFPETWIGL